jgi:type IV pilus assembly protein PilF
MTMTGPGKWDPRKWLACAGIAGVLLLAVAGCASRAGPNSASHDIMTESDEPEVRKRARIRMELAVGYFEHGQTKVALDELKQAIAIDPSFPEAYNMRGLIYMRLNDLQQAEASFRRAVSLNPGDSNVQHNYGWLLCQQKRYEEAQHAFDAAMSNAGYTGRAKTLMAQGICQARAGRNGEAEHSLSRSLELDPGNPVTGYNLASLLYQRGDYKRAQFYIRRINNSELANSESLWLGIKVEHRLNDDIAMNQLGAQLKKRFGQTREAAALERRAFDE